MNRIFTLFLMLCLNAKALYSQNTMPVVLQDNPFVLGRTLEIKSSVLSERRTLNIYLPEGYNPGDTVKYPVIYLLDGSAEEDFIHIAGLMQFATFPWINTIPKTILVGIANVDRERDFTYPTHVEKDKKDFPTTGGSAQFIRFIETELQPFIQHTYKTTGSRTLIGQSLGGLLATEILLKKPQLFSSYIIVSPSLWWDAQSLLSVSPAMPPSATSVYIAVGDEGRVMKKVARKLAALLRKQDSRHLKVDFRYFADKDHADILHQAVYEAFKAAVPSKK